MAATQQLTITVAPRAGAWIETAGANKKRQPKASRPARARGLKRQLATVIPVAGASRPARARGLKRIVGQRVTAHLRRAPRGRVD